MGMPAAQSTVPANVIWGDLILPDTTPAQPDCHLGQLPYSVVVIAMPASTTTSDPRDVIWMTLTSLGFGLPPPDLAIRAR